MIEDKDHVDSLLKNSQLQFAGRSNCLGKSVGNLLARSTGILLILSTPFILGELQQVPLISRLSPAWGDTTLYWSQWLKKGGDSESIGLSGINASCDLWHHAECAFPGCLLALEVRWCLGSHWHRNGSREAMPAKSISSTVPKIFLRFMSF